METPSIPILQAAFYTIPVKYEEQVKDGWGQRQTHSLEAAQHGLCDLLQLLSALLPPFTPLVPGFTTSISAEPYFTIK